MTPDPLHPPKLSQNPPYVLNGFPYLGFQLCYSIFCELVSPLFIALLKHFKKIERKTGYIKQKKQVKVQLSQYLWRQPEGAIG